MRVLIPRVTSGRAGLTHTQAVEEALCFGWIDGLTQARAKRADTRTRRIGAAVEAAGR